MKTMERPVSGKLPSTAEHRIRRTWLSAVAAVVAAFALGLAGGWALFSGDDEAAEPNAVLADGGELTARQQDMVAMVEDYYAAWSAGDGEAVEAMFVTGGTLRLGPVGVGWDNAMVLSAYEEGAIAAFVEESAGTFSEPDMPRPKAPLVVDMNWVINYSDADGTSIDVFQFNAVGDLGIDDAVVTFGS